MSAIHSLQRSPIARTDVVISGQVIDGHGPVAGVTVGIKGRLNRVTTDHRGRFILRCSTAPSDRVTAAKTGYFIAGAPASPAPITLQLRRLPAADAEDYAWVNPSHGNAASMACARCHAEIHREWSTSAHARAASNSKLLNLYDGTDAHGRPDHGWNLLADHPNGAGVCNACHAPTASFADDLRRLQGVAAKGVHCDYCHKIAEAPADDLGLAHGRYGVRFLRPAYGQIFLGPLDDVDRGEDSFAPLYRDSRYCASCHEGVVFGVHAYSTYSEWLASPARRDGKQCQTCHMAPTAKLTNIAPGHGGIERPANTLASHSFPGTQGDMLRRCVSLSARLDPSSADTTVTVTLRADGVGHRLPTGFVDRHLVLKVEAFDQAGQTCSPKAGPVLPRFAGHDAGLAGKIFGKQLADFQGHTPVPFWRADPRYIDSRLYPDQSDHTSFIFGPEAQRIRISLLYHRFWPEVASTKGWTDNEFLIARQMLPIPAKSTTSSSNR